MSAKSVKTWSRRGFGKLALAAAGVLAAPAIVGAARAKVVVIGGGPGGATAARELASVYPGIDIHLVEPNRRYLTPFFANRYLVGMRSLDSLSFGYEGIGRTSGVHVVQERVSGIDVERKLARLSGGGTLAYDRLIMAPGADSIPGAIQGYGPDTEKVMPHAYLGTNAEQWKILRAQLTGMEDGGLVVLTVPPRPYRCHPAPYERASLIAGYLKRKKGRSKIVILDSNKTFPLMEAMIGAWDNQFGDLLEWIPADFGGAVVAVDAPGRTVITDDDRHDAAVANVIPPQRASWLARAAGLAGDGGWCPVNPDSFESTRVAGIHVLGDAIDPGDMPKSASSARSQGLACAAAVGSALTGAAPPSPDYSSVCYFLIGEGRGLMIGGRYRAEEGRITGYEGYSSEAGEDVDTRSATAGAADRWYEDLTRKVFG